SLPAERPAQREIHQTPPGSNARRASHPVSESPPGKLRAARPDAQCATPSPEPKRSAPRRPGSSAAAEPPSLPAPSEAGAESLHRDLDPDRNSYAPESGEFENLCRSPPPPVHTCSE